MNTLQSARPSWIISNRLLRASMSKLQSYQEVSLTWDNGTRQLYFTEECWLGCMYKTRLLEMCLAFPRKNTALRKLPARFVMLLPSLHSLDMFILVRFLPLLHLMILYGLLDLNLYVFMSFLYYRYLLYLFICVFISSIFIYFYSCKCLILINLLTFLHIVHYIEAHSNFMAYFRHLVLKTYIRP